MMDIKEAEHYLRDVVRREHPDEERKAQVLGAFAQIKKRAVECEEQEKAKLIWCYEQIFRIQNSYLSAFYDMKANNCYGAWCSLERVEIDLHFLEQHYSLEADDDQYKLQFIKKHSEQFQLLFPYKLFMSPAFLELEKKCSICGRPVSIRNPCGHQVGEIYDGEMCGREITKGDLLEISMVTDPVQKYSIPFLVDPETGEQTDHYDYTLVQYVISGLRRPFDAWDMRWTKVRHPHSRYVHVGRNDDCPCNSGKKYKNCCLQEPGVLRPHLEIRFSVPPPEDLPKFAFTD
jgi:hypothetical protein